MARSSLHRRPRRQRLGCPRGLERLLAAVASLEDRNPLHRSPCSLNTRLRRRTVLESDVPDEKIRVLIVDDEPEVAAVLDELVTGFGHRTAIAHNDVQAIRAVREFAPHVVLLDIRMPGIDGHTVLDHLRGSPQPPTVIIVSGNHEETEARELLQRGAFDYLTKPVDFRYLQQAIAAAAAAAPER